jgi:hypothetical protein
MNIAIINLETRIVENVTVLEAGSEWQPPAGYETQPLGENVGIGWSFVDGEWIEPPEPESAIPASPPESEIEAGSVNVIAE